MPSTSFLSDATFEYPGGEAMLRFEYECDGVTYRGGLWFHRVRAYRFRAEGHCAPWHAEDAYDTLVEVEQADWVGNLLATEPSETWEHWKIRHFLIYVDEAGAYDVAAESWSVLPEAPAQ